jgi:hypothetical protein
MIDIYPYHNAITHPSSLPSRSGNPPTPIIGLWYAHKHYYDIIIEARPIIVLHYIH